MIKFVNIINDIENLLFPDVCLGCLAILSPLESVICTSCRHQFPLTNFDKEPDNPAEKVFYGRVKVDSAASLLWFHKKGVVQQLIHQLKYKGHEEIGEFLGKWMGSEMAESIRFSTVDTVIPVPLHPKKLRKRGYNQVSRFGKAIALALGATYTENLLIRRTNSKTQTLKNRIFRDLGTTAVFEAVNFHDFSGKHILLVDDIITTGATLESCVNALKEVKNIRISVATMAITA